ncbi:MAG: hypothetical protein ACJ77K_15075 [Bacteroidia bacterium]
MSQFDFPRINFHGTVMLDVPTANNGYTSPLALFDQAGSEAFLPPRVYLDTPQAQQAAVKYGLQIFNDSRGPYIKIDPINDTNYQAWATTPLGSYPADASYLPFYQAVQQDNGNGPLAGIRPGYWDYWGDLTMKMTNVAVTGVTVPDGNGNIVTYTPSNPGGCPPELVPFLTATFQTTATMCDLDSVGQLMTQMFFGTTGLYDNTGNPLLAGNPVKASAHWMNINRVINTAKVIPTGGSANFYSMIYLGADAEGTTLAQPVAKKFQEITGQLINAVFMKINVHEVYEIRNPDYDTTPKKTVRTRTGQTVQIPTNPATASITGTISPFMNNDLKNVAQSRMLKMTNLAPFPVLDLTALPTWNSYGPAIANPVPQGSGTGIGVVTTVDMANVPFRHQPGFNIISLDFSNTIHQYGLLNPQTPYPPNSAGGDLQPFSGFETCNYGNFTLVFITDGGATWPVGQFNWASNYQMATFLANGGMIDIPVPSGADYSQGFFLLTLDGYTVNTGDLMQEMESWVCSEQQGSYCEEGDTSGLYLSSGLPTTQFVMRAFRRGQPIPQNNPVTFYRQDPNYAGAGAPPITQENIWDGKTINYYSDYGVSAAGCYTFGYVCDQIDTLTGQGPPFSYFMKASMNALRVLSAEAQLAPYLNGSLPITWDVVYWQVLVEYKTLLPIMDVIVPITEANWSEPFMQQKMLQLIDLSNWNQPLYMPVTRDLTATQRKLLQMWVAQSQQTKNNA